MTSCDFEFTAPSDLFHWDEHLATYNVRQQITVATLALNKMGFKNDPRVSFARLTLSDDKKKMTVRLAVSSETEDEVKDFLTSRHYEVSESEVNKATFRVSPLDACFSCLLIQEAFEKSAPSVEVVRVTGVPDACWVQVAHNEIRSLIDNNWTFSGRPLFWLKKLPGKERICTLCYKRDHSAKNCPQQPLATCYRCLAVHDRKDASDCLEQAPCPVCDSKSHTVNNCPQTRPKWQIAHLGRIWDRASVKPLTYALKEFTTKKEPSRNWKTYDSASAVPAPPRAPSSRPVPLAGNRQVPRPVSAPRDPLNPWGPRLPPPEVSKAPEPIQKVIDSHVKQFGVALEERRSELLKAVARFNKDSETRDEEMRTHISNLYSVMTEIVKRTNKNFETMSRWMQDIFGFLRQVYGTNKRLSAVAMPKFDFLSDLVKDLGSAGETKEQTSLSPSDTSPDSKRPTPNGASGTVSSPVVSPPAKPAKPQGSQSQTPAKPAKPQGKESKTTPKSTAPPRPTPAARTHAPKAATPPSSDQESKDEDTLGNDIDGGSEQETHLNSRVTGGGYEGKHDGLPPRGPVTRSKTGTGKTRPSQS